jgi:hypothetical protein
MPGFGRRPEFDEASRNYPVRHLLGPRRLPRTWVWACDRVLDQGSEGACVGYSWSHELIADPVPVADIDNYTALAVYHRAQQLDEWPGENYDGTSVLAGAKAIVEAGWLLEYRWAFGLADVLETLSYLGPVILGINWYDGMMDPNSDCYLDVSGGIAGGHAILARGVDVDNQGVLLHNSWGQSWGCDGTAWISWGDLDRLLHEDGEACVPVIRVAAEPDPEPDPVPVEPQGCLPRWLARWTQRNQGD